MTAALTAWNLGKSYRRYARPFDSLLEMCLRQRRHTLFHALAGVSFQLDYGETLGIVGDNGAGKSTLLKILSGTIAPSEGTLETHGRVSAILELGAGFHPEFSGLDNLRLGLALMGLSEAEAEARIPEIIEFSELEAFIHQPVKAYSSGMYVRLAFSLVTGVDPDILIVDEALAVGDAHFQKKCMDRMISFRERGKALLFCSHSLYQVRHLCDRVLWLDHGRMRMLGPVETVVDAYQDHVRRQDRRHPAAAVPPSQTPAALPDVKPAWIEDARLLVPAGAGVPVCETGHPLRLMVEAAPGQVSPEDLHVGVVIRRNDGVACFGASTELDGVSLVPQGRGRLGIVYEIPSLPLLSGEYACDLYLLDRTGVHIYDCRPGQLRFRVRQRGKELGLCWMDHRWLPPQS
ncbi:lipopolysaccharide transport system ATP-binding protein [Methylomarinovum caldicuralii]|uniref:Lipopolysaccharide transport system ATP-binding protein n=1 Tax=Methylomarinovum caldicuralii TaxID=438856 RepID=A0AAU9CGH7_9GAMM|nr:ABC transporter ATP-binding protein [Methylomarinovum caldicuralii]BCX80656.1 lipopolysaccharide transport system ATP-binding protein [Methylomarinovum caldicuralii]